MFEFVVDFVQRTKTFVDVYSCLLFDINSLQNSSTSFESRFLIDDVHH